MPGGGITAARHERQNSTGTMPDTLNRQALNRLNVLELAAMASLAVLDSAGSQATPAGLDCRSGRAGFMEPFKSVMETVGSGTELFPPRKGRVRS